MVPTCGSALLLAAQGEADTVAGSALAGLGHI
jgi:hypothetical protein